MFTWTDAYWISLAVLSGIVGAFIVLYIVPWIRGRGFGGM